MRPVSRSISRLAASSASRLCRAVAWKARPSVKIGDGRHSGVVRSPAGSRAGSPSAITCGVSVHCRRSPGSVNRTVFPQRPGVSSMAAPVVSSRCRNACRNRCSSCDSASSAGGFVGDVPLRLVGRVRRPGRARAASAGAVRRRRGRPGSPRPGARTAAGSGGRPAGSRARQSQSRTRSHARTSSVAQPLRVGELGQVAGAAGDEVVQQDRVVVVGAVGERRLDDLVRCRGGRGGRRAARAARAARRRPGWGRRSRRRG